MNCSNTIQYWQRRTKFSRQTLLNKVNNTYYLLYNSTEFVKKRLISVVWILVFYSLISQLVSYQWLFIYMLLNLAYVYLLPSLYDQHFSLLLILSNSTAIINVYINKSVKWIINKLKLSWALKNYLQAKHEL